MVGTSSQRSPWDYSTVNATKPQCVRPSTTVSLSCIVLGCPLFAEVEHLAVQSLQLSAPIPAKRLLTVKAPRVETNTRTVMRFLAVWERAGPNTEILEATRDQLISFMPEDFDYDSLVGSNCTKSDGRLEGYVEVRVCCINSKIALSADL